MTPGPPLLGAFMLSDDIFFQDPEGALSFNAALVRELAAGGPEPVIASLDQWTVTEKDPEPSWDDLVELLNSVSYKDRVRIGEAATASVEECGGLRERVLALYEGPTLMSCYIEFYDRHDAIPVVITASLEMNTNATANFGAESEAAIDSLPWESDTKVNACVEGLEAARAAYEATTEETPSPTDACDPASGYLYFKADQEWYMSYRGLNELDDHAFHARVWRERETWIAPDGSGRNHQVTDGPGFDSLDMLNEWLALDAYEPLETTLFTFDVIAAPGELPYRDYDCLGGMPLADPSDPFTALNRERSSPRFSMTCGTLEPPRHARGRPPSTYS